MASRTDAGVADAGLVDCHNLQSMVPSHCVVITEGQAQACYACQKVDQLYEEMHPIETSGMLLGTVFVLGLLMGWGAKKLGL